MHILYYYYYSTFFVYYFPLSYTIKALNIFNCKSEILRPLESYWRLSLEISNLYKSKAVASRHISTESLSFKK